MVECATWWVPEWGRSHRTRQKATSESLWPPRYRDEFDFRWNHCKIDDGEWAVAALAMTEGNRLTFA